ncbi:MAG TPA: hypothetical protein VE693_07155 [Gaiellaceae bacterium]|nr:hypothetical protein [Gaiellaceae bacterium]
MEAAGGRRPVPGRGAPRLLEHCAALERLLGPEERSARARLETLVGTELASLLCRALTLGPRPPVLLLA